MVKNWKSLLCFLLILAMVFSVSACGDSSSDSNNSSASNSASDESGSEEESGDSDLISTVKLTDTVNKYGWTVPEETIKISYYSAGDQLDQGDEETRLEPVAQVMKEEFNLEFEKVVFEEDSEERLNIMLASDDYPDVISGTSNTKAQTFIDQGRAIELTGYLEKYGQNILDGIGDYIGFLKNDDGEIYQMPWDWGHNTDYMGKSFGIRADMLAEQNMDFPDSFESYYEAVKALVEAYPTNGNGEKTYGITAFTLKGAEFYSTPLAYLGLYSAPTGMYKVDEEGKIHYWVDTDEGRFVANYINQFWRDGLIDPDFQTKDYDSSVAFMSNERVVANIGTWWHDYVGGHNVWSLSDPEYSNDKHFQEVTWEEEGYDVPRLVSDSFIRTYRTIITDKCENPDAVVMYWNWECTPLGMQFVAMGPAGEEGAEDCVWSIDENGDIKVDDRYWYGDSNNSAFDWETMEEDNGNFNYWMMAPGYVSETYVDDPSEGYAEPIIAANLWDLLPDFDKMEESRLSVGQLVNKANLETAKTYMYDATLWNTTWSSDSEYNDIYLSVNEKLLQDWCLCITAETPEECEALYDQMVDDLHALDLDTLVEAQQEAYDKNLSMLDE